MSIYDRDWYWEEAEKRGSYEFPKADTQYRATSTAKQAWKDKRTFKKQRRYHTSETGVMIRFFGFIILEWISIFLISDDGAGARETIKTYASRLMQRVKPPRSRNSLPVKTSEVTQKEFRLIGHITNDLSPILITIENTLKYNDVGGIRNWIFSETVSDSQLGSEIRKMRNTKTVNDQNGDDIINCEDFAILFFKLAKAQGYDVKIISNSKLNHSFNAVRRLNGTWETIEPQAGAGGRIIMRNAWKNYDPAYDEDTTGGYRRYL
jgi:hypothetical protein